MLRAFPQKMHSKEEFKKGARGGKNTGETASQGEIHGL